MTLQLSPFANLPLDAALLQHLIDDHEQIRLPRLTERWNYYRNARPTPRDDSATPARASALPQAAGLPERLVGPLRRDHDDRYRREIVIENDIGWRIQTLVDFMFPAPPRIVSKAKSPETRRAIEFILSAVINANGGAQLWQDAALLGSVYGHVDFLISVADTARARHGGAAPRPAAEDTDTTVSAGTDRPASAPSKPSLSSTAATAAARVVIETVEAPRAIALLNPLDYRRIDAFILHYEQPTNAVQHETGPRSALSRLLRRSAAGVSRETITVTEIHSRHHMQRYEDDVLVADRVNRLGVLPVVHVQNLSQPLQFDGLSDVEPLICLQDELNTRLSDRANRVTMQSFKMWLGKGVESFTDRPIGPGQMWMTDNPDASIESFGGDAESPSEVAHVSELREAMDKASGVTPAAAGHIQARVGNLTSENALRISLMGTIAKTKRKRVTYGQGVRDLAALVLHALDVHRIYRTDPMDREIELVWADPIPPDETRRIEDAIRKLELGIDPALLRAELGYADETR